MAAPAEWSTGRVRASAWVGPVDNCGQTEHAQQLPRQEMFSSPVTGCHSPAHSREVALRRHRDCLLGPRGHIKVPPATIDAVEVEGGNRLDDLPHERSGQRDEVRVAAYKADEAAIGDHLDRVTNQEDATALGTLGPVEDRAALEMAAALDQRDAREQVQAVMVRKR